MAQKIVTQLIDDLDGTELGDSSGETVRFALDGQAYEIDLSAKNAKAMRTALSRYLDAARRSGPTRQRYRRAQIAPSAAEVRDWARSNGYQVPERGRIPQDVRDAFDRR